MSKSAIEWTDETWNPVAGCSLVSPGCTNCYAMKMAHRLEKMGQAKYTGTTEKRNGLAVWTGKITLDEAALQIPLKKKKPTRYFVNSMSDLFHEGVPDEFIDKVFAVMERCPQHTFQILTKRPERMAAYTYADSYPLKNVWLGTSAEDQQRYNERAERLCRASAFIRFLSLEPLLGPINLRLSNPYAINWVIVGGESGPGSRPFQLVWAHSIVEQCKAAGIPVFVKQLGANPFDGGYALTGWGKKGSDMAQWPVRLCVRQFPQVTR